MMWRGNILYAHFEFVKCYIDWACLDLDSAEIRYFGICFCQCIFKSFIFFSFEEVILYLREKMKIDMIHANSNGEVAMNVIVDATAL